MEHVQAFDAKTTEARHNSVYMSFIDNGYIIDKGLRSQSWYQR